VLFVSLVQNWMAHDDLSYNVGGITERLGHRAMKSDQKSIPSMFVHQKVVAETDPANINIIGYVVGSPGLFAGGHLSRYHLNCSVIFPHELSMRLPPKIYMRRSLPRSCTISLSSRSCDDRRPRLPLLSPASGRVFAMVP